MSGYIDHITLADERWDQLAWRYYGDAMAYEQIIAANPDVPIIPVLPGGVRLVIPVLDSPAVMADLTGLPPWLLP